MNITPKSTLKRSFLLSIACLCMLAPSAKARYQDELSYFYEYYYYATTLPAAYRAAGNASYQVTAGININLAYAKYYSGELAAVRTEQDIWISYGSYYDALGWLAFYNGDTTSANANKSLANYYYNYSGNQRTNWDSYYNPIISYFYNLWDTSAGRY